MRAREKIDATVNRGNRNGSLSSFVFLIYDADKENRRSFLLLLTEKFLLRVLFFIIIRLLDRSIFYSLIRRITFRSIES